MDSIENKDDVVLTGEVQEPNDRQRIYDSQREVLDFISAFGIKNCNIRSGYDSNNELKWSIEY